MTIIRGRLIIFTSNPTAYLGKTLTWTRGRLLASYGSNTYSYNADGIRFRKNDTEYILDGNRILAEVENGTVTKRYFYDGNGIAGMEYDGSKYYFRKNLQGDVVSILNESGTSVASYTYDAWGAVLTSSGTMASVNPFRYRGYYYDTETKLYYLQSRYYDPSTGRFLNPDTYSYSEPEKLHGLNLYVYCNNDPVMYVDHEGTNWWSDFWNSTAGAITKISISVVAIGLLAVGSVFTGGLLSVVLAGATIGAIGGAAGGLISGGVSGGGLQGIANGMLVGTLTGAISGAVGASPLGVGFQIAINAGLGMANYAVTQSLSGQSITLAGLAFNGIIGGIAGLIGGSGWMHGEGIVDLLRVDVAKNFMKGVFTYVGLGGLLRSCVNSAILSGCISGLFGLFEEKTNGGKEEYIWQFI